MEGTNQRLLQKRSSNKYSSEESMEKGKGGDDQRDDYGNGS